MRRAYLASRLGLWLLGLASGLGLAVIAAIRAPAVTAMPATAGYSVRVRAPGSVGRKRAFTITASGSARTKSHVILFLAQQPCADSYATEYNDIGARRPEQPYFQLGHGVASRSNVSSAYAVRGSFKLSVTAYTGRRTGTQYACAYVPSSNPTVTRAHASATYRVT